MSNGSNVMKKVVIVVEGTIPDDVDINPADYKARIVSHTDAYFNVINAKIVKMEWAEDSGNPDPPVGLGTLDQPFEVLTRNDPR